MALLLPTRCSGMAFSDPANRKAYEAIYLAQPHVREARRRNYKNWSERNKHKRIADAALRRLEKRAMCLVATTRTRARKRGLAFDLSEHVAELQARIDLGVCELTGYPFDLSPGRKFNSPSFDRINPSEGYSYDNVRVVLNLVNAALGDWGEETLRDVMGKWLAGEIEPSTRGRRKSTSKASARRPASRSCLITWMLLA